MHMFNWANLCRREPNKWITPNKLARQTLTDSPTLAKPQLRKSYRVEVVTPVGKGMCLVAAAGKAGCRDPRKTVSDSTTFGYNDQAFWQNYLVSKELVVGLLVHDYLGCDRENKLTYYFHLYCVNLVWLISLTLHAANLSPEMLTDISCLKGSLTAFIYIYIYIYIYILFSEIHL